MPALQVARGHVVDDRVAEHVVVGAGLGDAATAAPDHHAELGLVVEAVADAGRIADVVTVGDHAFGRLGEDDRGCRHGVGRRAGAAVETAAGELVRMLVVVLAHAEDVARRPRDRCLEAHARQRRAALDRAVRLDQRADLVEALDQRDHVGHRPSEALFERAESPAVRCHGHDLGFAVLGDGRETHRSFLDVGLA